MTVRFGSFSYMDRFDDKYSFRQQDVVMWMWQLRVRSVY
jgi:hypothetical protein